MHFQELALHALGMDRDMVYEFVFACRQHRLLRTGFRRGRPRYQYNVPAGNWW